MGPALVLVFLCGLLLALVVPFTEHVKLRREEGSDKPPPWWSIFATAAFVAIVTWLVDPSHGRYRYAEAGGAFALFLAAGFLIRFSRGGYEDPD